MGENGGFGKKLSLILGGLDDLKESINVVAGGLDGLKSDVNDLKSGIDSVKENISGIKSGMGDMKKGINSIDTLKDSLGGVLAGVGEMTSGLTGLKDDVSSINEELPTGTVENSVAEGMRSTMGKSDALRDEGLTTPEDIERFDDIVYGPDAEQEKLDIYRLKASRNEDGSFKMLPVIVSVHGGAWLYGSRVQYQFYCMSLAQRGFAVINFDYRLAPEYKFPASLEDVCLVFDWLARHGSEYGLDTENIIVVGDSAGGHLAGLYACMYTDPEFAAVYGFSIPEGICIRAMGLNCGAYDPNRYMSERELWSGIIAEDKSILDTDQLNVTDHMNDKFPPTYLMSATGDFCFKYFDPMLKCLEKHGIEAESRVYGNEENKLGHVFHLNVRSSDAQECNDNECSFFKKILGEDCGNV